MTLYNCKMTENVESAEVDSSTASYSAHAIYFKQGKMGYVLITVYCYPASNIPSGTIIDLGDFPSGFKPANEILMCVWSRTGTVPALLYTDLPNSNKLSIKLQAQLDLYGAINYPVPVTYE